MKKLVLTAALIVCTAALTACKSGTERKANNLENGLNALGQGSWTYVKADTRIKGFSVFLGPDGKYHAIDVSHYVQGTDAAAYIKTATVYDDLQKSIDTYQQYGIVGSDYYESWYCPYGGGDVDITCTAHTDINGNIDYYNVDETDYGWYTVNEDIYTDAKSGLVFDIGANASKDLEAVAGAVGSQATAAIRQQLVAQYGLSQDRAADLASLAQSWQSISSQRSMTAKDLAEFQVKAFGSDLNTLSAAKKKADAGDAKDYNSLLQKAAQMNEISPEQAKSILNSFM